MVDVWAIEPIELAGGRLAEAVYETDAGAYLAELVYMTPPSGDAVSMALPVTDPHGVLVPAPDDWHKERPASRICR